MTGNYAIIILAAGSSARMGRPKQLLSYHDKSFLENAIDNANGANVNQVIVVLGAHAAMLENSIEEKKVHIVENKEWNEGIASSIRCGLNALLRIAPLTDAVIFMVCDQLFVSSSLLNDLIATQKKTGKMIVGSQYENTIGTPALFSKIIFPELLQLRGDTGAKKIIEKYRADVATVLFAMGASDIDTEEDYEALN